MAGVTALGYASCVRHPMFAAIALTLALLSSAAASAAQPGRCATTALRDLPGGAGFGVGITDRPVALDVVDSATLPLRVHRTAAATAAQTALVLQALEAAWTVQVDGAGFAPPLDDDGDGGDDGLDVYLSPLPVGVSAVTISGVDVDDDKSRDVRSAFIVIDPRQPDDLLAIAAHHEFQHALQFGVDADESVMWFEATAVAFEVRGRPDVTSWQEALPPFQTQPQAPLGADSISFAPFATSTDDRLEYGAGLFALYLDDTFGDGDGRILRELWTAAAGSTADDDDDVDRNEPDWRDALELLGDAADIQRDFLAWRALAPPLSIVGEGPSAYALGGGTGLRGKRIVLENLAGVPRTTLPAEGPFAAGCLVLSGTAGNAAAPVYVRAESTQRIGVTALVIGNGRVERSDKDGTGVVALDVVVPAGRELVLGICDLSPWDADAAPVFSPVRLTIDDAPIVDRGAQGEGEGEGEGENGNDDVIDAGCGCDSTSTGPAAGDPRAMRKSMYTVGFFIGVFGFAMKAWRHLRRRRLYKQSKARRP